MVPTHHRGTWLTMTTVATGLTRADLEALREVTDDGRRDELLDGIILVRPSPSRRHRWCPLE